jgi:hypothetical protein
MKMRTDEPTLHHWEIGHTFLCSKGELCWVLNTGSCGEHQRQGVQQTTAELHIRKRTQFLSDTTVLAKPSLNSCLERPCHHSTERPQVAIGEAEGRYECEYAFIE